ncbi:hypothetical protein PCC9214_03150 [Planktothrix tepida]|uniref:VWFA domain-containing protein n=1 Tax=Planktothrix tepida PCC 9214 TaxID=671072 RepID=A0A1J1LQ53_9CYAN|nr:hypothetical protein [Planktothrix tepida]CAD5960386.1 hypothetical protein PCC9214_03150 [Planktothrix tepida]CUR34704.1 hypothetical protein PL9214650143 [Planktothrix tepida PCC 9214]
MDCPRDHKQGRRMCDLVQLPNHQEWLCTECKSEFIKKGEGGDIDWGWLLICILGFLFLVLVLSGCEKPANLLLIRITDISASALNDPEQLKISKDACFGVADVAKSGDKAALIQVSQDLIASDPTVIKDQSALYSLCHKKTEPTKGQGTYICGALELAGEMSDRHSETLMVILQVQANEQEEFCPKTLTNLGDKVASRNGMLLVVGSTNDGNTGFNSQLWDSLKDLHNTHFCNQNIRNCVKDSIQKIRSHQE